MAFITDKQTLDDLAIFGKPGSKSVYSLFNCTRTGGGAALLKEFFEHPLSNVTDINERAEIIAAFAAQGTVFPFNTDLFGLVEQYLQNTDERSKITSGNRSAGKDLISLLVADDEYKLIKKGVIFLQQIFVELADFLKNTQTIKSSALSKQTAAVRSLLDQEPFCKIVSNKKDLRLKDVQIAGYDDFFRFRKRDEVIQLLKFIYLLDVYIAASALATRKGFGFPKALDGRDTAIVIKNAYHPLLDNAKANSISLSYKKNIIFLTGANMAGKSTLMKTAGISLFLAHMGFPVPAEQIEFTVFDGIYTTINLPDNLGVGNSHFYAEVLRIKKIAKELSIAKRLFVIFDELFRGTNVKDAHEATVAVVAAFATRLNSCFIISTHIIEAGEVLKDMYGNLQFLYMPTRMQGNTPVYSYQAEQGITNDRHGMMIIRNERILDILNAGINKHADAIHNG